MPKIDLKQYFPFLNRVKGALPRGEMLALRPLRNVSVAWEAKPEAVGVQLTVPRRDDKLGQLLGRVFQVPTTKTIELDEFGAAVWEKCDGKHSVEQLVMFTASAYKLNRRQAEVSVVSFMRMLAQRKLIGLDKSKSEKSKSETGGTAHVHRNDRPRTPGKRGRRRY